MDFNSINLSGLALPSSKANLVSANFESALKLGECCITSEIIVFAA
jgi:hypothetical protein